MASGRLALLCILWVMALPSYGVDYYVDASADDGDTCVSDNGAGTIGDPWGSLFYAGNQIGPGDTLFIRGGVYRETGSAFGAD